MKRPILLVLLLIAALTLFAAATLGTRSVAADEFSMYWAAAQTPSDIVNLYFSPKENNPPGMALVQHFWGLVFGFGDISLRALSLCITLAALGVLWNMVSYFSHHLSQSISRRASNNEISSTDTELKNRAIVFLIAATTPIVWMSATIARYQGLVMLLGLSAVFAYLLWLREKAHKHLILYAILAGAMFYVHYLSGAVFALCAGLHYCTIILSKKRPETREILIWVVSQVGIIVLILPIVVTIATAYSTINLAVSAPVQSNKVVAAVMFFAATMIGIMNGFAVAPYSVWVVIPMAFILLSLTFIALRRSDMLNNRFGWMMVVLPLVVMSAVVVKMYPPLTIYLVPSAQRVPYLAPLLWMFLGFALVRLQNERLRTLILGIAIACNVYAIGQWNTNTVATQHTPPLQELRTFVRANTKGDSSTVIAHTVAYRYGMEGVNSMSPSSKNAIERYLPEITSLYWQETDIAKEITPDSCTTMIRTMNARHWIIFQRNRYPVNARNLAYALEKEGYVKTASEPAQSQSDFDIWMKQKMLKLPVVGSKDEAIPQKFLYTFLHFEKK